MFISRNAGDFVRRDGSLPLTANWNVGAKQLKNAADPTDAQDLTTRSWVLANGGGGAGDLKADGTVPLTANWGIAGFRITGAADPVGAQDYATKAFVLANTPSGVILANGSVAFTASQSMGGFSLTSLAAPSAGGDAVNKTYADSTFVPLTRTVTGTAPVTVNGVNTAVALSGNLTVAIVDASGSVAGAVSTGSQTFAGTKTFNGGVVMATGQNVSGASELNLNAATGQHVNFKINNVTAAFIGPDGSLQMGTSVTPALSNAIVFKNNAGFIGLTAVTVPGTQVVMMTLGTDDQLAIGDTNTFKAIRHQNGFRGPVRSIADANATITENDSTLRYSSITATRTVTLPSAATVGAGFRVKVKDGSNSVTNAIRISVVPPSGTIEGVANVDISVPYGQLVFESNGTNWELA